LITVTAVAAIFLGGCSGDDMDMGDHSSSGALEAPMLMKVMPMQGALHLEWMNMQTDGDMVEAERRMPETEFAQVFSIPGTVDNKMDAQATDNMVYTYRLRCKKGDAYSDYSNELSANPTDPE
jgi:hypothetical protein